MSSKIQVSRGDIVEKQKTRPLVQGELFWQRKGDGEGSPWDEGTLYFGDPNLDLSNNYVPIAGARTYKANVYKGAINNEVNINDPLFKHVRVGDFYVFAKSAKDVETADATDPIGFASVYDFRKNDILLITACDFDEETGISSNIDFIRIYGSSAFAEDVYFDKTGTNFDADHVDEALKELETEKLSYRGTLESQKDVMLANSDGQPHIGTLYLINKDDLDFSPYWVTAFSRSPKRGDFVAYPNAETGWTLIRSGNSDASDIDYNQYEEQVDNTANLMRNNAGDGATTFKPNHISELSSCKTIRDVIDYMASHKAQLDETGKVPLSQLHATVLGALQYKGIWNPLISDEGITDMTYQNEWPNTGHNEYDDEGNPKEIGSPANGDYYVVQIKTDTLDKDSSFVNIQYVDRNSFDGTSYTRTLELNNGDYIIWQQSDDEDGLDGHGGRWEKIDNSDRLGALAYSINAARDFSGQALYKSEVSELSLVGIPHFSASDKVSLVQEGANNVTIAGVRLVDQKLDDDGKIGFIPRYSQTRNTLENSWISTYIDNGEEQTHIDSNTVLGAANKDYDVTSYGSINIFPFFKGEEGLNDVVNKFISIFFKSDDPNELKKVSIVSNEHQTTSAVTIILPEEDSTVVGKLKGDSFNKDHILKSVKDGYATSTSIKEHLDEDGNPTVIEFESDNITSDNVNTRNIRFGEKEKEGVIYEDGNIPASEKTANLIANRYQEDNSHIEVVLPKKSGVLINAGDLLEDIHGTEKTLPIFGKEKIDEFGNAHSTLVDSKIKEIKSQLLANLELHIGDQDVRDSINESTYAEVKNDDTLNIGEHVVVGELNEDGSYNPKSLQVTKSLIMGNDKTAFAHLIAGREQSDTSQYRNAEDESPIPERDIKYYPPAASGVLLTDKSRIDGGLFI